MKKYTFSSKCRSRPREEAHMGDRLKGIETRLRLFGVLEAENIQKNGDGVKVLSEKTEKIIKKEYGN